jgi:hypothetical protein
MHGGDARFRPYAQFSRIAHDHRRAAASSPSRGPQKETNLTFDGLDRRGSAATVDFESVPADIVAADR